MEKARARSRATCGARPRSWTLSSAAASLSPARRRMDRRRSFSTRSNSASPPCSFSTSPTSAPSTCTSSRSAECFAGNWMSSRLTKRGILQCKSHGVPSRLGNHAAHEFTGAEPREPPRNVVRGRRGHLVREQGAVWQDAVSARRGFELLVAVRAVLAMPLFAWFAVRANSPAQPDDGGQARSSSRRAILRRPSPESPATTSARCWISGHSRSSTPRSSACCCSAIRRWSC